MGALQDDITIETDLFNHRKVLPHFINDCCFGEDLAEWLREDLAGLEKKGFTTDAPVQEDFGWGLCVRRDRESCWIALSYVGDGPTEEPGQWVVSICHRSGVNPLKRLFGQTDASGFNLVRDRVFGLLRGTDGIEVINT